MPVLLVLLPLYIPLLLLNRSALLCSAIFYIHHILPLRPEAKLTIIYLVSCQFDKASNL